MIQVTTPRKTGGNQAIKRRGAFLLSMPLHIEERDRIPTDALPIFDGVSSVVIATGSNRKGDIHKGILTGFSGDVVIRCPEKDYGVPESESSDSIKVARLKGDVVEVNRRNESSADEIILAGDVVVAIWKPGDDADQVKYLTRPDRALKSDDPELFALIQALATNQAELMYSNGNFFASWQVGANMRRRSQGIEHRAGIRIKAEMKSLPRELVRERVARPDALKDNSYVDLISLVKDNALKVTIRNVDEGKADEVEVDIEQVSHLLELLVLGSALPNALFAQMADRSTPTFENGNKKLNLRDVAIMPRERD